MIEINPRLIWTHSLQNIASLKVWLLPSRSSPAYIDFKDTRISRDQKKVLNFSICFYAWATPCSTSKDLLLKDRYVVEHWSYNCKSMSTKSTLQQCDEWSSPHIFLFHLRLNFGFVTRIFGSHQKWLHIWHNSKALNYRFLNQNRYVTWWPLITLLKGRFCRHNSHVLWHPTLSFNKKRNSLIRIF